jgi:putative aminopeptidase FrvX
MLKESMSFLRDLMGTISPSGFEEEAMKVWKKRTARYADKVTSDVHGNSIAVVNGKGKPRVMFAGHADEIGYMVKYIDKEGYLYFDTIGGVDLHLAPGERVWIKTAKGRLPGVIGRKPIHLLEPEERRKVAKLDKLWIDIGASDGKETAKLVAIGDPAVPAVGFQELRGDRVVARGFDDKAGAFVVSEALRLIGRASKASVYSVATVQEELGLRGAKTSAFGIDPQVGIAVDVTFATDCPDMNKKRDGDIKVGSGPVISRGANINHKIFDMLVAAAKRGKIPYQVEGAPRATGTDANVIQLNRSGVAAGLVSVPNRYMHTPVELVSLQDLDNTARLLAAFVFGL